MRTFDHFPGKAICPICGTSEDKPCFLVPIDGTREGSICQAQPVHTACINFYNDKFRYNKEVRIIYILAEGGEDE
jgi:hypothetical protein